jgi:thiol-disulfide isomerase/thioredoxin
LGFVKNQSKIISENENITFELFMKLKISIVLALFILAGNSLFSQKKANLEGIEPGEVAPEIMLPKLDGENFQLTQLKDKLVLVYFWASWCAPCRKKAPDMVEVFEKFKDADFEDGENGFEIVYVSLDKNEVAWKRSIEKDGIGAFIHIGDMKGWKSPTMKTYNIRRIPSNVLLDGKGKVLALNLSPDDLKKKLKRMKKGGWFWF